MHRVAAEGRGGKRGHRGEASLLAASMCPSGRGQRKLQEGAIGREENKEEGQGGQGGEAQLLRPQMMDGKEGMLLLLLLLLQSLLGSAPRWSQ